MISSILHGYIDPTPTADTCGQPQRKAQSLYFPHGATHWCCLVHLLIHLSSGCVLLCPCQPHSGRKESFFSHSIPLLLPLPLLSPDLPIQGRQVLTALFRKLFFLLRDFCFPAGRGLPRVSTLPSHLPPLPDPHHLSYMSLQALWCA